jgi:hypothetical protein
MPFLDGEIALVFILWVGTDASHRRPFIKRDVLLAADAIYKGTHSRSSFRG